MDTPEPHPRHRIRRDRIGDEYDSADPWLLIEPTPDRFGVPIVSEHATWTDALGTAARHDTGADFTPLGWLRAGASWHFVWECARCLTEHGWRIHVTRPADHARFHWDADAAADHAWRQKREALA